MRRLLRWTVGLVIVLVILTVTAAVLLQTAWFHEKLRRAAVSRSQPFLNGELAIGELSGNVLQGITLRDVSIRQAGETVIAIPLPSARYDIVGLLRGRYELTDVDISQPVVALTQAHDGWNLGKLLRERRDSSGHSRFAMRGFHIDRGRLTVVPIEGRRLDLVDIVADG